MLKEYKGSGDGVKFTWSEDLEVGFDQLSAEKQRELGLKQLETDHRNDRRVPLVKMVKKVKDVEMLLFAMTELKLPVTSVEVTEASGRAGGGKVEAALAAAETKLRKPEPVEPSKPKK